MKRLIEHIFNVKIIDKEKFSLALEHLTLAYDASVSGYNNYTKNIEIDKYAFQLSRDEIQKGVDIMTE